MLKKLASLLLSLLLCLSLLPDQARAADKSDPLQPPVTAELLDSEVPVMPVGKEMIPEEDDYLP